MSSVFTMTNPAFSSLAFCSAALALKMFLVSILTSKARGETNAFANPEDASFFGKGNVRREKLANTADPKVERVRRNHLNDLENIPVFVLMGVFYLFTGPATTTAIWHFRAFTISRFCHMICYQLAVPQPSRALSYVVGLAATASMAVQILAAASF